MSLLGQYDLLTILISHGVKYFNIMFFFYSFGVPRPLQLLTPLDPKREGDPLGGPGGGGGVRGGCFVAVSPGV